MKKFLVILLTLAGFGEAQTVLDGGRIQWSDSTRWGDSNDSTGSLLIRKTAKFRDSAGTWRSINGGYDSCSLPQWLSVGTRMPNSKLELSYEVRTSSGNTDSSQVKLHADTRYCRSSNDTTKCESWVASGRFQGDTTAIVYDSIITVATTSGTTWKPTRQMLDVPGGSQIRLCLDGYKTGAQTNDSTFFRRFVLRTSSVPAGGTPPASVTVSGGAIATSTNQTNGSQKGMIVDGSGNVVGSTANALDVNIKSGSGSGVSVTDSAAFTRNSSVFVPAGGFYQANQTTSPLASGRQGMAQMTRFGALHATLRDSAGAVLGNSSNPIRSDPTGTTPQPASQSGTWNLNNISGTVSLPTGAATEATLAAESAKLPATLGQKAMSASMAMVLASDQSSIPTAATLQAGSAIAGKFGIDQTTPGTTNGVQVNAALPAGTNAIGKLAANDGVDIGDVTVNGVPSDPFGANADAASATGSFSAKLRSLATKQTDGSAVVQLYDSAGSKIGSTNHAMNVNCGNCSGSGVSATDETAFTPGSSTFAPGGGLYQVTQTSNPLTTGQQGAFQTTRFRALHVTLRDSTGAVLGNSTTPVQVSLANTGSNGTNVNVTCSNCSGSGVSAADEATFTAGTTSQALSGGFFQTTATNNALTNGQQGALQLTAQRALFVNPRNSSGTEIATASNPYRIDPTGTTTQPVSDAGGSLTVDGTVAATQSGTWVSTGAAATDAAVSGNPVYVGSRASAAAPTDVSADGDVVPDWNLRSGAKAVQPTFAGVLQSTGNGTAGTGTPRVTIASDNTAFTVNPAGSVAHDGVGTSVNPVLTGGYASAAAPTDVSADGDAVRGWHLRSGAYVTQPTYGGVLQSTGNGTAGTGTPRVTIASDNTAFNIIAAGPAAHDAAVSGNPIYQGGRARTSDYTAVANDDLAAQLMTTEGKTVVQPIAIRASTWNYAAAAGGLVNTTGVTAKSAAGAAIRNCVDAAQIINEHASTSTEVIIEDGAAGTVLWRGWAQAAGGGSAHSFTPPLCGTANTLIEIKEVTATASTGVVVNLQGHITQE